MEKDLINNQNAFRKPVKKSRIQMEFRIWESDFKFRKNETENPGKNTGFAKKDTFVGGQDGDF